MWIVRSEGWETIINQNNSADPEDVVELAASKAFDDWGSDWEGTQMFEVIKNNELVGKYEVEAEFSPSFWIYKIEE
jgi:hypothetical protein